MHLNVLYILVFSVVTFCVWRRVQRRRRNIANLPLPPGPSKLPLLGNLLNFPRTESWLTAAHWQEEYGNLLHMEIFGNSIIFANSYSTAIELLDKRSLKYSSRPPMPMLRDLMGWDWALTLMPYGPKLRKHRTFLRQFFQSSVMERHHATLMLETHRLVMGLIESPKDFIYHVRRATAAIIMMIAYGHEVAMEGDIYVKLADESLESFSIAGIPGAFLVDFFPILKYVPTWFPGAGFKRKAKVWHKLSQSMLKVPYAMTKRKILDGTARPSMTRDLVESNTNQDGHIDGEEDIAACAAITYAAGSDTTVSALNSFLLALVLYPEVQKRGQEEVDRVVGRDRLPNFEDRASLPYINGIVKETLRWNPVVPGGAAHTIEEDDVYDGYFIPAGTIVLANHWAMLHDETEYPAPFTFMPERWILKEGQNGPRDPNKVAFGFGRRICPGKELAQDSIYITVATVLATLDVEKALDIDGQPITPPGNYNSDLLSHPEPFECAITPRTPEVISMLRQVIESEQ